VVLLNMIKLTFSESSGHWDIKINLEKDDTTTVYTANVTQRTVDNVQITINKYHLGQGITIYDQFHPWDYCKRKFMEPLRAYGIIKNLIMKTKFFY